jgi:hypothetical protein
MENVGILYGHLYILRSFGMFGLIWYIFPRVGILFQEKSGNPAPPRRSDQQL